MINSITPFTVPPVAIFIIGALLVPLLKGKIKKIYLILLPVITFIDIINLPHGKLWSFNFLGYELFTHVDKLSIVFGYIFTIMAFAGIIYSLKTKEDGQYIAALLYIGSSLGVVFSGDLISLLIFWEIMAISSLFLILYRKTKKSCDAGFRYILVHAFGGSCLMAGVIIHIATTGSTEFGLLSINDFSSLLIFLGFIINAAIPPLHAWLTDAYPEATIAGAVFLSVYTTKTAVYVLARSFPGTDILILLGAIMAIYPIFYAVIENDARRVLCYSLVNQAGFMIVGIGIGTELSINGSVAHAFCNILFEGLLFMVTGAVLYVTGTIKCTELGGLYKTMPKTMILCIVGAASISAFPFFSGFVSKSLIMQSVIDNHLFLVWLGLLFASAGVFHYASIKIPYFIFFAHDSGKRPKEPPLNMLISMAFVASLSILIGIFPKIFYQILPYPVDFVPYTQEHVLTQLQLLFFAALAFYSLITTGLYPPGRRAINLDTDWLYRKSARIFMWFLQNPMLSFANFLDSVTRGIAKWFLWFAKNPTNAMKIAIYRLHLPLTDAETEEEIQRKIHKYMFRHLEKHERLSISIGVLILIIILVIYLLINIL